MPLTITSLQYTTNDVEDRILPDIDVQYILKRDTTSGSTLKDGDYVLSIDGEVRTTGQTAVHVYAGRLISLESERERHVIIKAAWDIDTLLKEATIYSRYLLPAVEAGLVPGCHGVDCAVMPGLEEEEAGCLILDYAGQALYDRWNTMRDDRVLKLLMIETLMGVHQCGIVHGNIEPRHLTIQSDEDGTYPRLIDFSEAREMDTVCSCRRGKTIKDVAEMKMEPRRDVWACDEVWHWCNELKVWPPRLFPWHGICIRVDDLLAGNVAVVAKTKKTFEEWDEALEEAYVGVCTFLEKHYPEHEQTKRIRAIVDDEEALKKICAEFKEEMERQGDWVEYPEDTTEA
ncbi:unnamed protein product [Peniophora sp. CBMAI 1063]|nr:unnamed protein product [Peniophora sp. CBMAI 1063]